MRSAECGMRNNTQRGGTFVFMMFGFCCVPFPFFRPRKAGARKPTPERAFPRVLWRFFPAHTTRFVAGVGALLSASEATPRGSQRLKVKVKGVKGSAGGTRRMRGSVDSE